MKAKYYSVKTNFYTASKHRDQNLLRGFNDCFYTRTEADKKIIQKSAEKEMAREDISNTS